MRISPGARFFLVLLLVLSVAGCAVTPPEWAWFDVDRHPVGAVPAQGGFYLGAYVLAPAFVFVCVVLISLGGNGEVFSPSWEGLRGLSVVIGTGLGLILGAPFHLLALPFGSRGTDDPDLEDEDSPYLQ